VINDVYYKHKTFNKFIQSLLQNAIGIDFGYIESPERKITKRFEVALMSTKISKLIVNDLIGYYGDNVKEVFEKWENIGLIIPCNDDYKLSGSGCYFISNMIDQLRLLHEI
jgi:hypothetical protein